VQPREQQRERPQGFEMDEFKANKARLQPWDAQQCAALPKCKATELAASKTLASRFF
jgi:hypothetical protein